jgi:hypothetical protein
MKSHAVGTPQKWHPSIKQVESSEVASDKQTPRKAQKREVSISLT